MSLQVPNPDVDLEQGQVSERSSDAGISNPTTGGQRPVERQRTIRHTSVDQDLGPFLPNTVSAGTPQGSVRPASQVQNTEREDPASTLRQVPSVGQDTPQIPGNTTHFPGVKYGPGEILGDPSRQMWTLSLSRFEKHDREITDRWKSDTDGVLVFTGLFSATVATFVIESYKGLSVDTGGQTVTLLTQMSQQLVGISNGIVLPTPSPLSNSPPNLPSVIRVNILWTLSLAISITCALLATLIQQWTRQYMALSYLHTVPQKRARVRAFLFTGVVQFRMRQAVEAIPILLHTSVFLFFAGLVDFFLLYNKTVAWVFVGWVGLFASIYTAMTVIPTIIFSCPYRTPFTGLLWRLSQLLAVIMLVFMGAFATSLDSFLRYLRGLWGRFYRREPMSTAPLLDREKLAKQIATYKYWFSEGLHRRVVSNAIDTSSSVDREALIWTPSDLDEDKEIENYISRIPGFFDARVVPEALQTMLGLMDSPSSGGDSVLAVQLGGLLKTCLPTTSGVDSGVDKHRLNICLTAIWCYTKAYHRPSSKGVPMPKYFRGLFADQNQMNSLLANDDFHTKVVVQCMSSLFVAKLLEEMRGQTESPQVSEGELVFLKKALGPLWRLDLAGHKPMQLTNLDSMLSELEDIVKGHMRVGETLGHEVLDAMTILVEDVIDSIPFLPPPTELNRPDLSVLRRTHGLLERCLMLSEQCGADTHLGSLMRSDAVNSLVKILEGLNTRLEPHAGPHYHPESPPRLHGPDQEVQLATHEDGMPHGIVSSAIGAGPPMGTEALTSTLAELYEDNEFEAFVAYIPTLFDSYVSNTSIDNILDLMAPSSRSESTLAPRLHKFFKACLLGKSNLDPDASKRRLRVSLAAIWSYARVYCNSNPSKRPIPEHFWRLFGDANDMDLLPVDGDTDTRVGMLCINLLLTAKIVEDSRYRSGNSVSEGEFAFLQKALSSFWWPGHPPVSPRPTKLVNLLAMMLDGLANLAHQEAFPLETLGRETSKTLDILARAVQDSLSEDPPPEPRGTSASVIKHSRRARRQYLSLLGQMSEGEGGLLKNARKDPSIGRLGDLSRRICWSFGIASTTRAIRLPDDEEQIKGPISKRRALLVGISYKADHNTWSALDGPHEDVDRFQQLLVETYEYRLEDITVLKDNPNLPDLSHPTRVNVIRELRRLVSDAAPGDTFVFLYSGHSDQKLAISDSYEGYSDLIITSDEQAILDNELNDILVPLPIGCSLLAVLDASHSGTLLDLPHHHCNSVYVPWQSKGTRRTLTMQNNNVRRQAAYFTEPASLDQPLLSIATTTDLQEPGDWPAGPPLRVGDGASEGRSVDQRELSFASQSREARRPRERSLFSSQPRSASPEPLFVCNGWCDHNDDLYPTVLSLSPCSDSQRAWEGPNGSLTTIVCDYLKTHSRPSYRALMSHINFQLHDNALELHKYTRYQKKQATRGKGDGFDGELDNFQDPVLSSLAKLDMDDVLKL